MAGLQTLVVEFCRNELRDDMTMLVRAARDRTAGPVKHWPGGGRYSSRYSSIVSEVELSGLAATCSSTSALLS